MGETPRRLRDVSGSNALADFRSEDDPIEVRAPVRRPSGKPPAPAAATPTRPASAVRAVRVGRESLWWAIAAAVALIVVAAIMIFRPALRGTPKETGSPEPQLGRVTLDTVPGGVQVLIGGQIRGITPLTIPLPAGHHEVILRNGTEERTVTLEMTPGAEIIQRLEFAATPSPSKLTITTDPPGARIAIDGQPRGMSPITLTDLTVGRHKVSVTSSGGSSDRFVTTEPGTTTSVVFALPKAAASDAGWLTIASAFDVNVVEHDQTIGTSAASKIMIPAGSHELDLVNPALGYQSHRKVVIDAGKTAVIRIEAHASLNANARPWAEVTIDGAPVGVTPIANQSLSLGKHQVIFRHPDLGERREDVVVTQQGPNRISVDMTK
jgi:serine/threonine-protein kinase